MSTVNSPLMLLGIGGVGVNIARAVSRAYASPMRLLAIDTDASSGIAEDIPFKLLGGNRLAGHGTGGSAGEARQAFNDNPGFMDDALSGVRTAVVVTSLAGGTGAGATPEILKRLHEYGIATIVFGIAPFSFEGETARRNLRLARALVEQEADVSAVVMLDDLVAGASDNLGEALRCVSDRLGAGVSLLWRLLERPGYIALDSEQLRSFLIGAGRARFAVASATGEQRVQEALAEIAAAPNITHETVPHVRAILAGILAGDDLRLTEVANVATNLVAAFGSDADLKIGTVNDEATFGGRLMVVALIFEESATLSATPSEKLPGVGNVSTPATRRRNRNKIFANVNRFTNTEKFLWHNEDLDIPTYLRRNLTLDR